MTLQMYVLLLLVRIVCEYKMKRKIPKEEITNFSSEI